MRDRTQGVVAGAATWLWVAVVVMALVSGGCAPPNDDAAGAGTGDLPERSLADEAVDIGAERSMGDLVEPVGSGPFRLVIVGETATDPISASAVDPADMAVLDLLYDGLTRWDDHAGAWMPEVAVSIEVDRSARVWTFVLGDRRFSDGRPIGSDDVVGALERVREGSAPVADRLDHVASVRAVNAATVQVRLTRPDATFPALLSHPLMGITPPLDGSMNLDGRVGSGPLHVAADDPSSLVRAVSEIDGGVEVEIVSVDELEEGVELVRSDEADLVHVPPSYDGVVDGSVGSGVVVAYAVNVESPLLGSAESRGELLDLIDVALVAGALPGLESVSTSPSDPGDRDRGETLPESLSVAIVGSTSRPEDGAAPAGVAASEVADGIRAEAAMAAMVASQWVDAGVEVRVEALSLAGFVSLVSAGDHDVIRTGWVELYPGDRPHWRLVDARSGENVTGVDDAALRSQMRRAARDGTAEAQRAVDDAIADLGVLVPIGRLQTRIVMAPGADFVALRPDGSLVFGD